MFAKSVNSVINWLVLSAQSWPFPLLSLLDSCELPILPTASSVCACVCLVESSLRSYCGELGRWKLLQFLKGVFFSKQNTSDSCSFHSSNSTLRFKVLKILLFPDWYRFSIWTGCNPIKVKLCNTPRKPLWEKVEEIRQTEEISSN